MICSFCALEFEIHESRSACSSCPLARLKDGGRSCRFVRCPRCGFENPVEPPWIRSLRERRRNRHRRSHVPLFDHHDRAAKSSTNGEHLDG